MRFWLRNKQIRENAKRAVDDAQDGWIVDVRSAPRSSDQNAKLHAALGEIAKKATLGNRKLDADAWKTIMVSAHAVATKRGADVVIGLEGEPVNIRESTAAMSKERMSSLIEYLQAWCANNGVELSQ